MNPFIESQKYFKTPLQQWQYFDKYSRWRDDLNRRETWVETVDRAVDFLKELSQNKLLDSEYNLIRDYILEMKVMPSMRLLAMAGEAARRNNICLYNCSFMGIDDPLCFSEALLISMCGCGVGFSVEKKYIEKLPDLPDALFTKNSMGLDPKYIIEDNTEGWVSAIQHLFRNLYLHKTIPVFDYSQIRPAGSILKTKGGRASGPAILEETIDFIISIFKSHYFPSVKYHSIYEYNINTSNKLSSLDVHDIMCAIGNCAISGGTRRSAMISLFDLDDKEMLNAKQGQYSNYRWNANNSAVWDHDLTETEFINQMSNIYNSQSGEPGIFNLFGIKNHQSFLAPRRNQALVRGVNPCQPDFVYLLTPKGLKQLKDLNVGDIIWSGKRWTTIINKMYTGEKEVKRYDTSFGSFIGTENHRVLQNGNKIEAQHAKSIDVNSCSYYDNTTFDPQLVMDGIVLGDGSVHKASNNLIHLYIGDMDSDYFESSIAPYIGKYRPGLKDKAWEIRTEIKAEELPLTYNRIIPKRYFELNKNGVASFLRGLYTANGSVVAQGQRVTLKQSSLILIKQVQVLLSSLGIKSYITTNKPSYTKHSNGIYLSRESYDLNITSDRIRFKNLIGFIQQYKNDKIRDNTKQRNVTATITSVISLGVMPVYDITVSDEEHTYWVEGLHVSNCGEIQLLNDEFCNLSSPIARYDDTKESLLLKVQVAALIGTVQSMATYFPGLRSIWKQNCEKERLLGVDLNGQMDCPLLVHDDGRLRELLRETAIFTNKHYAEKLGINQSVAVTCVKPNGNSSVLVDSASGLHPRFSKFYKRNVRVDVTSPLYRVLFESGAPINPENGQDWSNIRTAVISFPVKAPENSITRKDIWAHDQAEFWKLNKIHYTEHNPSVTIYYRPHEQLDLMKWLWHNKNILAGITVLPMDDAKYNLMPYEEITEEEYEKLNKEFPAINWEKIAEYELDDQTRASQELACVSGHCELN